MQKFILYLCFILLFIPVTVTGQKNEYNIKNIPEGLRDQSNVVVRKNITEFQKINNDNYEIKNVQAYTIFGKDSQNKGEFRQYYNSNFSEFDYIKGYIYDAEGNEIKSLDSDDIIDYSDFTSYSLFTDNRIKSASLFHNVFPYTVEFRYRIIFNGLLNWPTWYARSGYAAVQLSKLIVKLPMREELRFWSVPDTLNYKMIEDGKYKIYTWEAVNLPELPLRAVTKNPKNFSDYVITAPGEFKLDGHAGSMKSWKEFGSWYYKLINGRGELPETAKQEIKKQFDESDNPYDKIKKLYRYMQNKTRYVNISLGIGGWQPLEASFVHEKGYGDCKALTNYMGAILNFAGITSYPVLINSGDDYIALEDFSSNHFNHVILCVPLPEDTVWLECTSQTRPSNSIGWSNENRMALLISSDGGKVIHTPATLPGDNLQISKSVITFSKNGSASADMKFTWTGNQRNYNYSNIAAAAMSERSKKISSSLKVPDIIINQYNIEDEKTISESFTVSVQAELPRYASITGSRIFFQPNLTERRTSKPRDLAEGLTTSFNHPFADIDTVIYYIPAKYSVEALPQEINLETPFGQYKAKCEVEEDKIIYTRYYEIYGYNIPSSLYADYRNFAAEIMKADRSQVVLIQKK